MSSAALTPQLLNRLRMRQVALILAVGEHGTLRKASSELGMTQPAATKMIQELESALGQRLFERVGRGQKLTLAGTSVLRHFHGLRGTFDAGPHRPDGAAVRGRKCTAKPGRRRRGLEGSDA